MTNRETPDAAEIAAIRTRWQELRQKWTAPTLPQECVLSDIDTLLAAVEALEAENAALKAQWNDHDLVWQHAWRMRDQATGDCATSIVDDDSVPYNRPSEGE